MSASGCGTLSVRYATAMISISSKAVAAFSSGHVTDEMIQDYLKHHKNHPNHQDDNFAVE
jgi:hypothetical protein